MALPKPLIVCDGTAADPCTYAKLIELAQNLITDLIFLSTILATISFAYAGIVLLTSGGSEKARDKAKGIFWSVLKGFGVIIVAWIVIYTITNTLLKPGYTILAP